MSQAGALAVAQVDGVAVDRAFAQEALRLVGVEVVAGLGEEVADPGDLVQLFGKVGLHQAVGEFAPEAAKGVELLGRRGRREARRYDRALFAGQAQWPCGAGPRALGRHSSRQPHLRGGLFG